jgi:TonB family protein
VSARTIFGLTIASSILGVPPVGYAADTITPPAWLRTPTAEELARFAPANARGVTGRVVLSCEVAVRGTVDDCKVLSENPAGRGFGSAALLLTSLFLMRPRMVNGQAVGGAKVQIPIMFPAASGGRGASYGGNSQRVFRSLTWSSTPTAIEMTAAFPASLIGHVASAHVVLRCQLTERESLVDCDTVSETVTGRGFAVAARRLAKSFRFVPPPGQANLERDYVDLPFDFRDPSKPALPFDLADADWIRDVDPIRASQLFPAAAAKAGIKTGSAVVDCKVTHEGALTDCAVASETPPGLDFGKSALTITQSMAMNPWTREGVPVDGAQIRLPIRIALDPNAPPPP